MQNSATINIKAASPLLKAYKQAIEPESDFKTERGSYTLSIQKNILKIDITATDLTVLRATITSILGLLSLVEKTALAAQIAK